VTTNRRGGLTGWLLDAAGAWRYHRGGSPADPPGGVIPPDTPLSTRPPMSSAFDVRLAPLEARLARLEACLTVVAALANLPPLARVMLHRALDGDGEALNLLADFMIDHGHCVEADRVRGVAEGTP
jgi:hypothetical protein